ncbi:STAS domain-containing protein [Crossiella sp. NPDC003009]
MGHPPHAEPSPPGLDIVRHVVAGTVVISVVGDVDTDTAPALHAAAASAIDDTTGEDCILDLTEVTFLNSAGLTALVEATARAEARREPLRIVVDSNRPVIRPIELTGLDELLRLYHTVEEALTAGNQSHHES